MKIILRTHICVTRLQLVNANLKYIINMTSIHKTHLYNRNKTKTRKTMCILCDTMYEAYFESKAYFGHDISSFLSLKLLSTDWKCRSIICKTCFCIQVIFNIDT